MKIYPAENFDPFSNIYFNLICNKSWAILLGDVFISPTMINLDAFVCVRYRIYLAFGHEQYPRNLKVVLYGLTWPCRSRAYIMTSKPSVYIRLPIQYPLQKITVCTPSFASNFSLLENFTKMSFCKPLCLQDATKVQKRGKQRWRINDENRNWHADCSTDISQYHKLTTQVVCVSGVIVIINHLNTFFE